MVGPTSRTHLLIIDTLILTLWHETILDPLAAKSATSIVRGPDDLGLPPAATGPPAGPGVVHAAAAAANEPNSQISAEGDLRGAGGRSRFSDGGPRAGTGCRPAGGPGFGRIVVSEIEAPNYVSKSGKWSG